MKQQPGSRNGKRKISKVMQEKESTPDNDQPKGLTKKQKKIQLGCFAAMVIIPLIIYIYIKANPLVFNESWLGHAHCMNAHVISLSMYAENNDGVFPYSPKGYADALELTSKDYPCPWMLTGPGYTEKVPDEVRKGNIPEKLCGRVYIQGLKEEDDSDIAILFDKMATPGGDHCHLPARMWMPLGREVLFIGGKKDFISNDKWDAFAKDQIGRLVNAGISREKAEWYYDQVDKEQP